MFTCLVLFQEKSGQLTHVDGNGSPPRNQNYQNTLSVKKESALILAGINLSRQTVTKIWIEKQVELF